MTDRKYTHLDDLTAFGFLVNALDPNKGRDGDTGASFPRSDAEDFSRGVRFVPGEVTLARRAGKRVEFVQDCTPCCWYWKMPDGTRVYHWDRYYYEKIARQNGKTWDEGTEFEGEAGPCPWCGNPNTTGVTVKPSQNPKTQLNSNGALTKLVRHFLFLQRKLSCEYTKYYKADTII